jgi:hypothetical protein
MVFRFQAGMKMYEVVWERDGEKLHVAVLHAADEAGAISRAEETFAEHPEIDFDRSGTTVRASLHKLRPMEVLSSLEQAVLNAIALQVPEVADALAGQQGKVRVTARENTGAGFYTTLDVSHRSPIKGVASPLGDVGATVVGLEHGMGFLLWLRDGHIHKLEGFSYGESTSGIDFEGVAFGVVGPRT